jgi:hypothetical protein
VCKESSVLLRSSFNDSFEGFWLIYGQFAEDFAVQGDVCAFKGRNQLAVGRAIQASSGINTCIPQLACGRGGRGRRTATT